jgi:hypothetical protein
MLISVAKRGKPGQGGDRGELHIGLLQRRNKNMGGIHDYRTLLGHWSVVGDHHITQLNIVVILRILHAFQLITLFRQFALTCNHRLGLRTSFVLQCACPKLQDLLRSDKIYRIEDREFDILVAASQSAFLGKDIIER